MRGKEEKSRVHREVGELSLLFEISQILDGSLDLREVAGPILKAISSRTGMLRGMLTLLNRETGEISIEAASGLSRSQKERGKYRLGEGVTGKVIETGKPLIVPRISEEPQFLDRTKSRKGMHKKDISFICVPIKIKNEVIGAFSIDQVYTDDASLKEDVRLLSIITSMIARAVRLRQKAAEELALDNCLRKGGAVYFHERPGGPDTVVVDGVGYQLLADTAFASDQHGGITLRHLGNEVVDPLHRF
jgi:Nif-specific regulatory protein